MSTAAAPARTTRALKVTVIAGAALALREVSRLSWDRYRARNAPPPARALGEVAARYRSKLEQVRGRGVTSST